MPAMRIRPQHRPVQSKQAVCMHNLREGQAIGRVAVATALRQHCWALQGHPREPLASQWRRRLSHSSIDSAMFATAYRDLPLASALKSQLTALLASPCW